MIMGKGITNCFDRGKTRSE